MPPKGHPHESVFGVLFILRLAARLQLRISDVKAFRAFRDRPFEGRQVAYALSEKEEFEGVKLNDADSARGGVFLFRFSQLSPVVF